MSQKDTKKLSNNNKRLKKKCNRGADCPYKNEFQHQLEYFHEDDGGNDVMKKKEANLLIPFSGRGRSMDSAPSSLFSRNGNTKKLNRKDTCDKYFKKSSSSKNSLSKSSSLLSTTIRDARLSALMNHNESTINTNTTKKSIRTTSNVPCNELKLTKINKSRSIMSTSNNSKISPSYNNLNPNPSMNQNQTSKPKSSSATNISASDYVDLIDYDNIDAPVESMQVTKNNDKHGIAMNTSTNNSSRKRKNTNVTSPTILDLCEDDSNDEDDCVVIYENKDIPLKIPSASSSQSNHSSKRRRKVSNNTSMQRMNQNNMMDFNTYNRHDYNINQTIDVDQACNGINRNSASMSSFPFITTSSGAMNRIQQLEQKQLSKAIAESNRDIKKAQDKEYYESLRIDQQKDFARERERKLERKHELKHEQELQNQQLQKQPSSMPLSTSLLHETKSNSSQVRNHKEKQLETTSQLIKKIQENHESLVRLQPEPAEGMPNIVTIAFRLPRKCKTSRIIRRFLHTSKADQLFLFLNESKEMSDVERWRLFQVMGGNEICCDSDKTLQELGLFPNGLVFVNDEDS